MLAGLREDGLSSCCLLKEKRRPLEKNGTTPIIHLLNENWGGLYFIENSWRTFERMARECCIYFEDCYSDPIILPFLNCNWVTSRALSFRSQSRPDQR